MKLLCLLSLLTSTACGQLANGVVVEWTYPTNELSTNLTFIIHRGTNVAQPVSTWTPLTNIVGTNLSATVDMPPGEYYFALMVSNFWGTSFSKVVSTPPPPRNDGNLMLRRK